jgi:hypothetical protein
VSGTKEDSVLRAYAVSADGSGPARRLGDFDADVVAVSVTRAGDVALVTRPPAERRGRLWLLPRPAPGGGGGGGDSSRGGLASCRGPDDAITSFVRREPLPTVHSVSQLVHIPGRDFTLFEVHYGPAPRVRFGGDGGVLLGVRYGGRIGWIEWGGYRWARQYADSIERELRRFELAAGDDFLFGTELDSALARGRGRGSPLWRSYLAAHHLTPPRTLLRLVRQDSALATTIATNPQLLRRSTSAADLLELAGAHPALAAVVLHAPTVRESAATLLRIAALPRLRGDRQLLVSVRTRLAALGPDIAENGTASEATLLALATSLWEGGGGTPVAVVRRMLLANPRAMRSAAVQAVLAAQGVEEAIVPRVPAARNVYGTRPAADSAIVRLARTVRDGRLPPLVVEALLRHSYIVQTDSASLLAIADATEGALRTHALEMLIARPDTPRDRLLEIARGLAERPDERVALQLLRNPIVTGDREILTLLARPNPQLPGIAAAAATRLRQLPP